LERMGVELTAQARRGDLEPVRCRDAEIARVVDILLRHNKNNPALIGKAGVGKTAIVEGLAQRIAASDVPPALKDTRVVALDHVALLAGTAFRGQYEERIRRLERHHAVAITDDALKAAIVLTDRFVPERARPDKAIDVLDEACAHAQATARVSPELDRLIRERRKVDAMIRRGLTHEAAAPTPPEDLLVEVFPLLERIGEEIEKMLGGRGRAETGRGGQGEHAAVAAGQPQSASVRPRPSLSDRRNELDRLLRQE